MMTCDSSAYLELPLLRRGVLAWLVGSNIIQDNKMYAEVRKNPKFHRIVEDFSIEPTQGVGGVVLVPLEISAKSEDVDGGGSSTSVIR